MKDRDVHPVRTLSGGRLAYLCPLPGHVETKPSFIVWTNAEFENFYCFGCTKCSTIIHLVREIEDLSFMSVITKLADGVSIDVGHDLERKFEQFINERHKSEFSLSQPQNGKIELSEMLLNISTICHRYLRSVKYNEVEKQIIDSVYETIDKDLFEFNFEGIEETHKILPTLIEKRRKKILCQE